MKWTPLGSAFAESLRGITHFQDFKKAAGKFGFWKCLNRFTKTIKRKNNKWTRSVHSGHKTPIHRVVFMSFKRQGQVYIEDNVNRSTMEQQQVKTKDLTATSQQRQFQFHQGLLNAVLLVLNNPLTLVMSTFQKVFFQKIPNSHTTVNFQKSTLSSPIPLVKPQKFW